MNQKEMLEIKILVTEMKNAFDGLISTLDPAEESTSVLEDVENWEVNRNFQNGKTKRPEENKSEYLRTVGQNYI